MQKSYSQILKSSALIGGSSVVVILIGIVRTKIMAILLGSAGFGLLGLYSSIVELVVAVAGMGINSSGVRQIAEATGSGDERRVARTAAVLRRTAIVLGLLGAAFLAVFSRQASLVTFGNADHAWAVALLSLAVFFQLLAGGPGRADPGHPAYRRSRPDGRDRRAARYARRHSHRLVPAGGGRRAVPRLRRRYVAARVVVVRPQGRSSIRRR